MIGLAALATACACLALICSAAITGSRIYGWCAFLFGLSAACFLFCYTVGWIE